MRCQWEHFAPTKFKIQIWVWNFGRGVEYSKIWRDGFPFARITFLLIRQSGNQTDVDTILKTLVPPLDQLIASPRYQLIASLLSLFLPLESIFQNTKLLGMTGKILVLKFKFEFEIWFWNLSLKFKLGSVFQSTRSLVLILLYIRSTKLGRGERRKYFPFGDCHPLLTPPSLNFIYPTS